MKKIIIIATVSYSIETLIKNQPKYLSKYFNVELMGADSGDIEDILEREKVLFKAVQMERRITPLKDLKVLFDLIVYFAKKKPDIVYSFTPKAGLLAMVASFFARCPVRIHNVVGMPLMEAKGKKKIILKLTEKITYLFATHIYCNSFGLKKYINTYLTNKKIKVIGHGSINGVDCDFYKDNFSNEQKKQIRNKLGLKKTDFIVSYMGRIVKDKGINELIDAFKILNEKYDDIKFLIVGKFEQELNPITNENKEVILTNRNIKFIGFQNDLRDYLSISNLFVLPSYREGLPNALIEAGSFGIPLLATDINGCNEIIIDGKNGKLVEKKSVTSLYLGIEELYLNKHLYLKIKSKVRESIVSRYDQKTFLEELKNNLLHDVKLD